MHKFWYLNSNVEQNHSVAKSSIDHPTFIVIQSFCPKIIHILLLFLLYINDLPDKLKKTTPCLYADDTQISYSSPNYNDYNELIDKLNSDLKQISDWLASNKLQHHHSKTKALFTWSQDKQLPRGGSLTWGYWYIFCSWIKLARVMPINTLRGYHKIFPPTWNGEILLNKKHSDKRKSYFMLWYLQIERSWLSAVVKCAQFIVSGWPDQIFWVAYYTSWFQTWY